ncbi:hypothetical protein JXR93_02440 [bacterium]|nr:hypothetical protein [bacterium]
MIKSILYSISYAAIFYFSFLIIAFDKKGFKSDSLIYYQLIISILALLYITSFRKIKFSEFIILDFIFITPIIISDCYNYKNLTNEHFYGYIIAISFFSTLVLFLYIANFLIYRLKKYKIIVRKEKIKVLSIKRRLKRIKSK